MTEKMQKPEIMEREQTLNKKILTKTGTVEANGFRKMQITGDTA